MTLNQRPPSRARAAAITHRPPRASSATRPRRPSSRGRRQSRQSRHPELPTLLAASRTTRPGNAQFARPNRVIGAPFLAHPDRHGGVSEFARLCRTEFLMATPSSTPVLRLAAADTLARRSWAAFQPVPCERAGTAGRVVGEGFVRTVVAFLTNDFAAVRARGRLVIIGANVQYRPDIEDGSGPRLSDDGLPPRSVA